MFTVFELFSAITLLTVAPEMETAIMRTFIMFFFIIVLVLWTSDLIRSLSWLIILVSVVLTEWYQERLILKSDIIPKPDREIPRLVIDALGTSTYISKVL